jgi:hypothetical protein
LGKRKKLGIATHENEFEELDGLHVVSWGKSFMLQLKLRLVMVKEISAEKFNACLSKLTQLDYQA